MKTFTTGLSNAQLERLALLMEEMGEAIQAIGKIMRHGYDSSNPHDPTHTENRALLEKELGDVTFAIQLMERNCDVQQSSIDAWKDRKHANVWKYLHHQG